MDDGWRQVRQPDGLPPVFEQILGTRDCDPAIGELVLRGAVASLFTPGGSDLPFAYSSNLYIINSWRRVIVRVVKAAPGQETRLVEGWREICEDLGLMPGDFAVFMSPGASTGTFFARFADADGNDRLSRYCAAGPPSSPEFQVYADLLWAQSAQERRGERAAGAAAAAADARALQGGDDITIREAMDLAVQCGAREGSDEHYMATKLFVKPENRAMFVTFRTNAGRLQWLRRCYQDRMN